MSATYTAKFRFSVNKYAGEETFSDIKTGKGFVEKWKETMSKVYFDPPAQDQGQGSQQKDQVPNVKFAKRKRKINEEINDILSPGPSKTQKQDHKNERLAGIEKYRIGRYIIVRIPQRKIKLPSASPLIDFLLCLHCEKTFEILTASLRFWSNVQQLSVMCDWKLNKVTANILRMNKMFGYSLHVAGRLGSTFLTNRRRRAQASWNPYLISESKFRKSVPWFWSKD